LDRQRRFIPIGVGIDSRMPHASRRHAPPVV
jgi:hypothetical protein